MGKLTTGLVTQLKVLWLKQYNEYANDFTKAYDMLVMKERMPSVKVGDIVNIRYPSNFEELQTWKQGTERPKGTDDVYKSSVTIEKNGISIDIDTDDIENGFVEFITDPIQERCELRRVDIIEDKQT